MDYQIIHMKQGYAMKKGFIILSVAWVLTEMPSQLFAGTPQTKMECISESNNAKISGSPEGEGFDLKIQIDNATIRYTNTCDGTQCATKYNYGNLVVVDALFNKVFTIYFENSENNNRGIFYALPNTVKYQKNSRGYTAQYTGIYWGDDPRSTEFYKAFVKDPGIKFVCSQQNEL